MKILVFGKDGQLGKAFQSILCHQKNITFIGRAECDLTNQQSLEDCLAQIAPNKIINTAAYTAVDQAEENQEEAITINAFATKIMAQYCSKYGGQLLYYSTDYVFDGTKETGYIETDTCNPLNVYGKSKLSGEQVIKNIFQQVHSSNDTQTGGKYLIFRSSWVYGEGENFIRTILKLAKERRELKVVADQYGVPTNADWLANLSLKIFNSHSFESGIYHAVPSGKTSWYELAKYILECVQELELNLTLRPNNIIPITTNEYPLPAKRPSNSILSTIKLHRAFFPGQSILEEDWRFRVKDYINLLHKSKLI
jgi:dTDP-4-dehydrorhamnose reductase